MKQEKTLCKFECNKCVGITTFESDNNIGGTIDCEHCGEMIDICPECKTRQVEIDDFGVVLCDICFEKNPKAKSHVAEMSRQEAYDTGRPMGSAD